MPPELLAGEDFTKPFDLQVTESLGVGTTSAAAAAVTTNHDPAERETPLAFPSPATTSKKPPPGKAA